MGLSITVGLLDDQARNDAEGLAYHRRAFARLSEALAVDGITWQEPEIGDPPAVPAVSAGFPHSHLTHLRRVFVLAERGELLTPAAETDSGQYERDCEKIHDETAMCRPWPRGGGTRRRGVRRRSDPTGPARGRPVARTSGPHARPIGP
ncbi:hypothetical protein EDD90_9488 [Streptomyces sp. Ag109_O5-1]|uniref:hypothetical protein n=1 Tax=Streptomyces sp. Ag109_O5-1 TaxID=1938851 RepID=UPI000F4D72AC|nr:hypothetical protein [Streptomyces sp. Ag109_O5-1]RPE46162.1 hypothetical protein EDD90_9488 [Streptomyces sp. Ag109_O5-1]